MHSPVLVTPPAIMPVTLQEVKLHLAVDHDDHDAMIAGFIAAAVDHLDGWTGILGRALVEQTWRIDFDGFSDSFRIPLGPVQSVTSLTVRNEAGQLSTVSSDEYSLLSDEIGPYVKFKSDFVRPSDLNETKPIALTWLAGYAAVDDVSTVPHAIRVAIMLLVGHWYNVRETVNVGNIVTELPFTVNALITPYRRVFF